MTPSRSTLKNVRPPAPALPPAAIASRLPSLLRAWLMLLLFTTAWSQPRLLLFSGNSGYRHSSIVDGIAAMTYSTYLNHVLGGIKYVLRTDGSTGLSRSPAWTPVERGARAWIGGIGRDPASLARTLEGYRLYDIRGTCLGQVHAGARGFPASFLVGIGPAQGGEK